MQQALDSFVSVSSKGNAALNLSSPTFLREETLLLLADAYDSKIENLKHELHQTKESTRQINGRKGEPNHSSAPCERSFSSLGYTKPYLPSTKTSGLAELSTERICKKKALDLDAFVMFLLTSK